MKIQNAEMEFVAFDAQDVITTSSSSISFQVTQSLFDLSKEQGWSYDGNIAKWSKGGFDFVITNYGTEYLKNNKYYTITKGVKYQYSFDPDHQDLGILYFFSNLTEGKDGTEVSSLESIIDWIETYGSWYN